MEMLEPSPSLAHLQARQRLCWAALTHQRLGPSAGVLPQVGPLLARVGTVGAAVEPGQQEPEQVARSSTVRGAVRGDARGTAAWHVARAARSLHQLPLCQAGSQPQAGQEPSDARAYRELADSLASRMVGWHGRFGGQPSWAHFLNKTSFLHEMEEVLLPLRMLQSVGRAPGEESLTVVDLCAGKGFLAMCLAHGVLGSDTRIQRVVMLEKARVNWAHLRADSAWPVPEVEIWGPPREKCNIFDEELVARLGQLPGKLLIVGVHLCRRLSSRAIELFNLLGAKAQALILAPCCIPLASGVIEVSGLAVTEAAGAKPVGQLWKNKVSAAWSAEDVAYEGGASGGGHCWNCGGVGHTKADCPHPPSGLTRGQIRRRRKFANRRPVGSIDTAAVVNAAAPFAAWCSALLGCIDGEGLRLATTVALPCADSAARDGHDDGGGGAGDEAGLGRRMTWLLALRDGAPCGWLPAG